MSVRPVVLCGSAGTRLWPMSRPDRPKALLALASERTLLADTVERTLALGDPWLVCGALHDAAIAREAPGRFRIVEPVARGTAPAAVAAAHLALDEDPDAVLLLVPADHAVEPPEAFHATIGRGLERARDGDLVVFGTESRGPSERVGWIEPGERRDGGHAVTRFVEKPRRTAAARLFAEGAWWSTGMVLARADRLVEEVEAVAPGLVEQVRAACVDGKRKKGRIVLGRPFAEVEEASFDALVLQRTRRAFVVPATFRWADMGSWPAVREARGGHAGGQVLTDGPTVKVLGDPDVLVAVTGGAVLVATPSAVGALGAIEVPNPAVLDRGPGWRVERWFVEAGARFDGDGTAVLVSGKVVSGRRRIAPGEVVPRGARARSAATWLEIHVEP
jgi:mannose-1-phosphate guanylyltransferase